MMSAVTVVLLLLVSAAAGFHYHSSYQYRYYGGNIIVSPKGRNPDGTFVVEVRNTQTLFWCYINTFACYSGHCGSTVRRIDGNIYSGSYHLTWCQKGMKLTQRLLSNIPFEFIFPVYRTFSHGYGYDYWIPNIRGSLLPWKMLTHVDLGTRSDTGESNRPPISSMLSVLRIPRNCPRTFRLMAFDPDGDHVRCSVPISSSHECSLCSLPTGFSLDEESCSLTYTSTAQTGYNPIEILLEDFANKPIRLSYSNGHFTFKHPFSESRRRREAFPVLNSTEINSTTIPVVENTTEFLSITATTTPSDQFELSSTVPASPGRQTTTAVTTRPSAAALPTSTATTKQQSPTTTAATPHSAPNSTTSHRTPGPPAASVPIPTIPSATTKPVNTESTSTSAASNPLIPGNTTTSATITLTTNTTNATTPSTLAPNRNTTTTPSLTPRVAPSIATTAAPTTTTIKTTKPSPKITPVPSNPPPPPTTQQSLFRASIPALSKIPLQFSVLVESHHAPSCLDGEYFPVFLTPTPANGANLPAYVNHTLEIRVKSRAQHTGIHRLLMTGPIGISQEKISTEMYIIRWTPTDTELNDHFPICFISEALGRYHRVYHSEPRCVTVDVGRHEAVVSCSQTEIRVEVEKTYLIRRNEASLHLNGLGDPSCSLKKLSNATHLVAIMSLNACGTRVEEDDDNIIFTNDITSGDPKAIISRQHDIDIAISCVYPKKANLTLGFTHKNPYAFQERGFGAFTFQFEFFQSQLFRQQVDASSYPVEVYLKQMMYMQVESTSSIPNTELFVESCRATPYDNPNSRLSYTIIQDGCLKDNTVRIFPGPKSQFRFGMEAFEFIGAHNEVYITCSVVLCESGVPGTRCSQGCIAGGNHRGKREAAAQTSSHFISQGPLLLVKTSHGEASGRSLNLGVNLLVIAGCLLICVLVIYRSRRSRSKYQRLPTSESR